LLLREYRFDDPVFCGLEVRLKTQNVVTPPPIARRDATPTVLHGQTLEDDYRWMREKSSEEVISYLEAENAYTQQAMADTEELQAKLYGEMLSHIKETDESVPYLQRGWFYSVRTIEGSQYPIHCRRRATGVTLTSRRRRRFCWM
jgi:oligopeptidase B